MEKTLASQPFFVGAALSLADVALVAYTRLAHEGGFDLAPIGPSPPGSPRRGRPENRRLTFQPPPRPWGDAARTKRLLDSVVK